MLYNQLSKVYYDEALEEAAQTRADRKAQTESKARNIFSGVFFLLVALPVIFLLFR